MQYSEIKSEFIGTCVSFLEAVSRFWTNRFNNEPSDEVFYLRSRIASLEKEKAELIEKLLFPVAAQPEEIQKEYQPIQPHRPNWRIRAAELEAESRKRKAEQNAAREEALRANRTVTPKVSDPVTEEKVIEDLEEELNINRS